MSRRQWTSPLRVRDRTVGGAHMALTGVIVAFAGVYVATCAIVALPVLIAWGVYDGPAQADDRREYLKRTE